MGLLSSQYGWESSSKQDFHHNPSSNEEYSSSNHSYSTRHPFSSNHSTQIEWNQLQRVVLINFVASSREGKNRLLNKSYFKAKSRGNKLWCMGGKECHYYGMVGQFHGTQNWKNLFLWIKAKKSRRFTINQGRKLCHKSRKDTSRRLTIVRFAINQGRKICHCWSSYQLTCNVGVAIN